MKKVFHHFTLVFLLVTGGAILSSFYYHQQAVPSFRFPYQKAGLTQKEAAAHLLSRFSFGTRPGEIEAVATMGLEAWFEQQLQAGMEDVKVEAAIAGFESLKMTNEEIVKTYPRGGQILKMAIKEGVIERENAKTDKKEYRDSMKEYMQEKA